MDSEGGGLDLSISRLSRILEISPKALDTAMVELLPRYLASPPSAINLYFSLCTHRSHSRSKEPVSVIRRKIGFIEAVIRVTPLPKNPYTDAL
jgi:hypothetical protein